MRFLGLTAGALLLATPAAAQSATSPPWLVGCWQAGEMHESWVRQDDGTLIGTGVMVREGVRQVTERLRLEGQLDRLVYVAEPVGQPRTEFVAEHANADSLVVVNATHDFPQRISYRRISTDTIAVQLVGIVNDAPRERRIDLTRRSECAAIGEVGTALPPAGSIVRIRTATELLSGVIDSMGASSILLRNGTTTNRISLAEVVRVDRQRRSAARGALIGGAIGGIALGGFFYYLVGALCESTIGCESDQAKIGLYGLIIGGAGGGLVGAGVGSLVPRWERVAP